MYTYMHTSTTHLISIPSSFPFFLHSPLCSLWHCFTARVISNNSRHNRSSTNVHNQLLKLSQMCIHYVHTNTYLYTTLFFNMLSLISIPSCFLFLPCPLLWSSPHCFTAWKLITSQHTLRWSINVYNQSLLLY